MIARIVVEMLEYSKEFSQEDFEWLAVDELYVVRTLVDNYSHLIVVYRNTKFKLQYS